MVGACGVESDVCPRSWTDAVRDEAIAICNYRVALADLERQKGTILKYCNVTIADASVPFVAHAHASHYIRQWTSAYEKQSELVKLASP